MKLSWPPHGAFGSDVKHKTGVDLIRDLGNILTLYTHQGEENTGTQFDKY